jgi:hypothetical protein
MRGKRVGDGVDQLRLEQRLVALNVDDDGLVVEPKLLRGFREAIGSGRMRASGHQNIDAVIGNRRPDALVVGGDDDARRTAGTRALGNPHDHRLAGDIQQRLARETRRRVARRDQDRKHQSDKNSAGCWCRARPRIFPPWLTCPLTRTLRVPACALLPRA